MQVSNALMDNLICQTVSVTKGICKISSCCLCLVYDKLIIFDTSLCLDTGGCTDTYNAIQFVMESLVTIITIYVKLACITLLS